MIKAIGIIVGAVVGNFWYQWALDIPSWDDALERSYYQIFVFLMMALFGCFK